MAFTLKPFFLSACAAFVYAFGAFPAQAVAPNPSDESIVSINLENDVFSGSDRSYTHGARLSWFSASKGVPHWLEGPVNDLPFITPEGTTRYGYFVGQSIFTPRNISLAPPNPGDRPYAGWLYGGASLIHDDGKRLDHLQLQVGIVGPGSLADLTQETVHRWIDSPDPKGWNRQLGNELGMNVSYQRKWRNLFAHHPAGLGFDVSPHVGASLGNVFTYAAAGVTVRMGVDLPADYGPPLIQPSLPGSDFFEPHKNWGWYLFAGFEGRAVGRNIFLDGNTFSRGPHVDKKLFVGDAQAGLAVTWRDKRLAYTQIFRSTEFEGQPGGDSYGALTFSMRF